MILLTGGGTGGHLAIAKAVASELTERKREFIYVGSTRGQDREWFSGQNCYFLPSKGFVGAKIWQKIALLFSLLTNIFRCLRLFRRHKISVVFCVGGYSAAPASIAALIARKKLIIHEQNSVKGLLNRILKPFATHFFSAFESEFCAYPVRDEIIKCKKIRDGKRQNLLIIGGSQGAVALNEFALKIACECETKGIKIKLLCGSKNENSLREKIARNSIKNIEVIGFCKDMPRLYEWADFAISRAGASASFELIAAGICSVLVPYKFAAKNHQEKNADFLQAQKLAIKVLENELECERIFKILDNEFGEIQKNLNEQNYENGAIKITDTLQKYCKS